MQTDTRPAQALDLVGRLVDGRLPRLHAAAVVVGLTDRNRTLGVVARGRADIAGDRPATPDTRFQIGSISKSFAATVALQEAAAGRLDLQAPITDYVPWFEAHSRFDPITLHHLLSHTSGLVMGMDGSWDAVAKVHALRETECGFAPGDGFWYSNHGYKLVGLALEAVTGRPFADLVAERVLAPLGMTASDARITLDTYATTATPYEPDCNDRLPHAGRALMPSLRIESESADGSIVSTAADMCAYGRLLLARAAGEEGPALSVDGYRLMTQRLVEDGDEPGAWYGYGLVTRVVDDRTVVGHSGGMIGYASLLVTDPAAGVGTIVLVNGDGDRWEIARYALAVARALAAGDDLPAPPAPSDPTAIADAEDFVSVFRRAAADRAVEAMRAAGAGGEPPPQALRLAARAGRLVLTWDGGEVALERQGDDCFLAPHTLWDRFHLRAARDDGRVVAFTHGPDRYSLDDGEGGGAAALPPSDPAWSAFTGHFRAANPWAPNLRVYPRDGRLLAAAPWLAGVYPSDEVGLVRQSDGRFRLGDRDWQPSRIAFDTIVSGVARRAVLDGQPYARSFVW